MQDTSATAQTPPLVSRARARRRQSQLWTVVGLFVLLLSLALFPPLLSLGRYQRRIAQSISRSLGRPVHLDRVSLNLLPLPSLSIENFVVDEDPAFGDEPLLRANTVVANLRVTSLWRRRIEISSMRFLDPSVNLVLRPDGHWNLQGVLLQAASIDTAPTAQRRAGPAPRFPYIEATGARLNLKLGAVKTPFSLTEADFALFLAGPQQWRMRLKAKPIRTDTGVSDTGTVEAEATLGRASTLEQVPLSFEASWRNAPLGETSRILFGRDLGMRGSMRIAARSSGTLGNNALAIRLELLGLHRSDFVPAEPVEVKVDCAAEAQNRFRSLTGVHCAWPVSNSQGATLDLAGSVADLLHWSTADLQVETNRLPAATLLSWSRAFSSRVAPGATADGDLSFSLAHDAGTAPEAWTGDAALDDLVLRSPGTAPTAFGSIALSMSAPILPQVLAPRVLRTSAAHESTEPADRVPIENIGTRVHLAPVPLPLGGPLPALLEGHADEEGYALHLSGSVVPDRLAQLIAILPPIGDGLPDAILQQTAATPVHVDLTASRAWGGPQVWTDALLHPAAPPIAKDPRSRNKPRQQSPKL